MTTSTGCFSIVAILIDEPTRDLDPLESYLVTSILAGYAKKYNRIFVITLEKPRSDIAPLLDRVTILSLGDVVYTGYTRTITEYFLHIGFPCPDLENPLMYYCMFFGTSIASTVLIHVFAI